MARRPASIVLLGILNLVGGGLGLICCTGCGGFLQVANANMDVMMKGNPPPAVAPPPGGGGAVAFQQSTAEATVVDLQIVKTVPSYRIYTFLNVLVSFILDVLLLLSGIGLLLMAGWGRILALGYAGLSLFTKLLFALYLAVFFLGPANAIIDRELGKNPQRPSGEAFGFKAARFGRDLGWLVFGVYPVVVLGVLLHPNIAKAFASRRQRTEEEEDTRGPGRSEYEEDPRPDSKPPDDDRFRLR